MKEEKWIETIDGSGSPVVAMVDKRSRGGKQFMAESD